MTSPMALAGLRVLDLSRVLAGPWCGQILGDLGADVVKVERPGKGDDTRSWGPPWATAADGSRGDATYYLSANRNKRSIAVDLHSSGGQAVVQRLIDWADVVIENYKSGDLARFGLDEETQLARRPSLLWCSITGFGHDSPNAARAGYDFMIQAESGHMSITGEAGGRPLRAGVAVADLTTGMYAATAVLAALRHRDATGGREAGEGQHIDMALFDVAVGWLANQGSSWLSGGVLPRGMGNQHPSIVPYQDFATATDPIALAVGNDHQFGIFARLAGKAEWAEDARFATSAARAANRAVLVPLVEAVMVTRPAAEWLAMLAKAGVPAGPINTIAQALDSAQAAHRGLVVEQPHATLGTVRTIAQPVAMTRTPPAYRLPPPRVGEHGAELLAELGYAEEEVAALLAEGAVARAA
ncbi:CaiB/BaiF CoA transferase family protein [Sandaracinobacteroides saxicola]|uniref:CoA transferase n=1 Tax=Sandaracinobacteroides saxicola TaxID=2759707 RepID=A0A7G5ILJ4_9SPHN|nr:CaiB/BaiF CoA-transferase family protein [Sandaracinobacteroides saxicola]QMW24236.1 CoA transferase [Sandaracinobacteroides saxicola]